MRCRYQKLLLLLLVLTGMRHLQAQQCTDAVFKFQYFALDSIYASNHIATKDHGSLVIGEARSYPFKKGLILRLNEAGDIIWSKQMQGPSQLDLNKTIELSDGGFIVAGVVLHTAPIALNIFIAKLQSDGTLQWQKFYRLDNNSNQNPVHIYQVTEGLNGDLLVSWMRTGIHSSNGDDSDASVLMRVNADGDLIWSKYLNEARFGFSNLAGIFLQNGNITVIGQAYDNTSTCPISGHGGLFTLMALDYDQGTLLQQKSYCFLEIPSNVSQTESGDHHYSAVKLDNGKLAIYGVFFQRDANSYNYKVIFDEQLNYEYSRLYRTPYASGQSTSIIQVLPSGEAAIVTLNGAEQKAYYGFLDNQENILSQKQIDFFADRIPLDFNYNFAFHYSDWSFREREGSKVSIINNSTRLDGTRIELTIMHKRGDALPCFGSDAKFITSLPLAINPTNWSWTSISDNRILALPANFIISDYKMQKEVKCILSNTCTTLKIKGNDTVCATGAVEFIGASNCFNTISWSYDQFAVTTADIVNDSTIRLTFNQPLTGPVTTRLSASFADCSVKDDLEIKLFPSAKPLPPDTVVCGEVQMSLSPGPSLKNYLWQDGTTNVIYTATTKGLYTVKTEDVCGNIFSDSIYITDPVVHLGKDTSICSGDSVSLIANTGFMSYNWSPSGFVQRAAHEIRVSPLVSSNYIVEAFTADGCSAKDSIKVNIRPSVSGFIKPDTSICSFDILLLKPTRSFTAYLWNDGTTAPSLEVERAGDYWLQVTDQYGCKGKESITVTAKTCSTFVRFPTAFSPNQDYKNDQFKPLISGRLTSYEFSIYNRWGQLIFSSTDPQKSWDGKVNGIYQSTGSFVWKCSYQLVGEEKQYARGTVLLLR